MLSISLFLIALHIIAVRAIGAEFQAKIAARSPQAGSNGAIICDAVGSLLSICNFSDKTSKAECLCYSSSTWVPTIFDRAASTCADYAQTALSDDAYSLALAYEGFCTSVGDITKVASPSSTRRSSIVPSPTSVLVTPTLTPTRSPSPTIKTSLTQITTTPKPTSAAILDIFTNPGCSYMSDAFGSCNSASPGFSTMALSPQALCLCYSSSSWAPTMFDGPVETCLEYVKTADPEFYTDVSAIEGFCTTMGDVAANGGSGKTTATGGPLGPGIGISLAGIGRVTSRPATSTEVRNTPAGTPAGAPIPNVSVSRTSGGASGARGLPCAFVLFLVAISVTVLL